jgi:2-methylcitrate dehydratase PrpD
MACGATHAAFLVMRGNTGPLEVFEGNKGFMDAIAGQFEIDWSRENLEMVTRTVLKKYNAEIHSQSAIERVLELQSESGFGPEDIEHIEIDIFDVAHKIIGGGEEGSKTEVLTKEQADHSLPYVIARDIAGQGSNSRAVQPGPHPEKRCASPSEKSNRSSGARIQRSLPSGSTVPGHHSSQDRRNASQRKANLTGVLEFTAALGCR